MRSETRKPEQVIADLDGHQDLLMPEDSFAVQHALLAGLGLLAGLDADARRQASLEGMANGMSADYDPLRKAIVLLPTTTRETTEALERGETEVLLGEYSGRIGNTPPLHFLLLMYLRGDRQVVVTLTATEAHWNEREESLRGLIDHVRIEAN